MFIFSFSEAIQRYSAAVLEESAPSHSKVCTLRTILFAGTKFSKISDLSNFH